MGKKISCDSLIALQATGNITGLQMYVLTESMVSAEESGDLTTKYSL